MSGKCGYDSHRHSRVGTSGWTYPPWRGRFYPPGLPHRRELEYLSRQVNSVEINGSFYSLRHALEVRHPSYCDPALIELLRAHGVALVVADTAGTWPYLEDVTADFVHVRLHGDSELYVSGYTGEALDTWAQRIRGWQAGESPRTEHTIAPPAPVRPREVFVYFDNDAKVHAPADAISLARKLT